MKQRMIPLLLTVLLVLSGCGPAQTSGEDGNSEEGALTVVATTYPVYLFASAIADGVEGVRVERLNTGTASCLHDYTLSVEDMRLLERADVIALNGAGLEDFMEDALASSDAYVVDCSQGVELLENLTHLHEEGDEDDHDHGHYDPHIWMDPDNAGQMVVNIQNAMIQLDPDHEEIYRSNGQGAYALLYSWKNALGDLVAEMTRNGVEIPGLITFHNGFQYFARAFDMPLLAAIEEEAGSEASAKEIVEITQLVKEKHIPVIFTEVNGSDATARAIARETGCAVAQLTMLMDGPDGALSNYYDGLMNNVEAVLNGFAGEEMVR